MKKNKNWTHKSITHSPVKRILLLVAQCEIKKKKKIRRQQMLLSRQNERFPLTNSQQHRHTECIKHALFCMVELTVKPTMEAHLEDIIKFILHVLWYEREPWTSFVTTIITAQESLVPQLLEKSQQQQRKYINRGNANSWHKFQQVTQD